MASSAPSLKKRGRPAKPKPPPQRIFTASVSVQSIRALSEKIASEIQVNPSQFTKNLAEVAVQHRVMKQLKEEAPRLGKKRGNRSSIHLAALLRDIAMVMQRHGHGEARAMLSQLSGYAEDAAFARDKELDVPINKYAKAILKAIGIVHSSSLRRQALQAKKLLP